MYGSYQMFDNVFTGFECEQGDGCNVDMLIEYNVLLTAHVNIISKIMYYSE